MKTRYLISLLLVGVLLAGLAGCGNSTDTSNLEGKKITVYYSPNCSCCGRYIDYLEKQGLQVKAVQTQTRELTRAEQGIPRKAASCHTSVIGNYFVEGHVPVQSISKLIGEQPDIAGITIPGMPKHAPGMGRPNDSTLQVQSVGTDERLAGVYQDISY